MDTFHHTLIEATTIAAPLTEDELVQAVIAQVHTIDLPPTTDPWRSITFHALTTQDGVNIHAYTFGDRMVASSLMKFSCDITLEITGDRVSIRVSDSWIRYIHAAAVGDYEIPHVIISFTLTR